MSGQPRYLTAHKGAAVKLFLSLCLPSAAVVSEIEAIWNKMLEDLTGFDIKY
jgi:hypothetical protein